MLRSHRYDWLPWSKILQSIFHQTQLFNLFKSLAWILFNSLKAFLSSTQLSLRLDRVNKKFGSSSSRVVCCCVPAWLHLNASNNFSFKVLEKRLTLVPCFFFPLFTFLECYFCGEREGLMGGRSLYLHETFTSHHQENVSFLWKEMPFLSSSDASSSYLIIKRMNWPF